MRLSFVSAAVVAACAGGASAIPAPAPPLAPNLPISAFNKTIIHTITLEEAKAGVANDKTPEPQAPGFRLAATCGNPRTRIEWDSASDAQRNAFIGAIKCLQARPASGQFPQAKNRYEDLVALHQNLTPNVHTNAKFLIWHRYYLWTFEDMLRTECGYNGGLLWWDESRYAGRFHQSSVFSSQYFGSVNIGGQCVTDGQFAGLTLNVGPVNSNGPHCLSRSGDNAKTANVASAMVSTCNQHTGYADMAACAEGGAHAWGHNGIGSVMQDPYGSPGDPVFWLHHGFIDRNYRIWQNANSARISYIDGRDRVGTPLTLDTTVSVNGLRPSVRVRDILNTMDTTLCYKYNY